VKLNEWKEVRDIDSNQGGTRLMVCHLWYISRFSIGGKQPRGNEADGL